MSSEVAGASQEASAHVAERMAHREEPERLSGALAQALGQVANQGRPTALDVVWALVAGGVSAQACRLAGYEGGVLRVEAETAAWRDALQAQLPSLEARLREHLPGFQRLELRLRGTR